MIKAALTDSMTDSLTDSLTDSDLTDSLTDQEWRVILKKTLGNDTLYYCQTQKISYLCQNCWKVPFNNVPTYVNMYYTTYVLDMTDKYEANTITFFPT